MYRSKLAFTLVWGLALSGCGLRPPPVHGATAILPEQDEDTEEVWVYIDSANDERDGVYRCTDTGASAVCTRAEMR